MISSSGQQMGTASKGMAVCLLLVVLIPMVGSFRGIKSAGKVIMRSIFHLRWPNRTWRIVIPMKSV